MELLALALVGAAIVLTMKGGSGTNISIRVGGSAAPSPLASGQAKGSSGGSGFGGGLGGGGGGGSPLDRGSGATETAGSSGSSSPLSVSDAQQDYWNSGNVGPVGPSSINSPEDVSQAQQDYWSSGNVGPVDANAPIYDDTSVIEDGTDLSDL